MITTPIAFFEKKQKNHKPLWCLCSESLLPTACGGYAVVTAHAQDSVHPVLRVCLFFRWKPSRIQSQFSRYGSDISRLISAVSVVKPNLLVFRDPDIYWVESTRKFGLLGFRCRRKPRRSNTRWGGQSSDDRNWGGVLLFFSDQTSVILEIDGCSVRPNANPESTCHGIYHSWVKTAFSLKKPQKKKVGIKCEKPP